jgi:hypothetical protein
MESPEGINEQNIIESSDHDDDQETGDLKPFFEDDMDVYAVIVGGAIIAITLILSLILYKLKKDNKIKTSIFREIED